MWWPLSMRADTESDPGVDLGTFSRRTGSVSVQALRNGSVALPSLLSSFLSPSPGAEGRGPEPRGQATQPAHPAAHPCPLPSVLCPRLPTVPLPTVPTPLSPALSQCFAPHCSWPWSGFPRLVSRQASPQQAVLPESLPSAL